MYCLDVKTTLKPSRPIMSARCLFSALLLFLSFGVSAQETRFISDELRVPLRKSPCGSCAIIHRGLVSGTKLTLLEVENDWARIETGDGLTGWLPSQYLMEKPIARERLDAARANSRFLDEANSGLQARVEELEAALEQSESANAQLAHEREQIGTELAAIKKASSNAVNLQEQNEALIKENRMLQSQVDVLTATKDQLVSNDSQKWFIYGGLAVFLGALLAVLIPQLRPRKRFSEWG